jgi:hydroxyacylglutathione hydrolase
MKIRQFEVPGLAQYSYVVSSNGEAVVIDPMRDVERYLGYAARHRLRIALVTETHIHADFASGARALAEAAGAELALSAYDDGERYRYGMPHRRLREGEEAAIGRLHLRARHTPGHTPEHLSFLLFDNARSVSEPAALFTGDFLFAGSLGRPDLLGEEEKQRLARDLYQSLHSRIASLPDGLQIYPGHGAGSLCGSGMSERADSTLGYERATQPLFRLTEEAFVKEVLDSVPPMPAYYPRMKSLNSEGAPLASPLAGERPLTAAEVARRAAEGSIVLDLRSSVAFGGAHIPGAINIGAGQNLSLWAGWLLDPSRGIILVGDHDNLEKPRRALLRVGLDRLEGYLARGMTAWIEDGRDFSRTPQVATGEVLSRNDGALVLDVRSAQEWEAGHIEGAQHLMLGELPNRLHLAPRNRPLVTVCGSGYRSSIAASLLAAAGHPRVSSMNGGMAAWCAQRLPLDQ